MPLKPAQRIAQTVIEEVEKGGIQLTIDTVYKLDQVAEAHQYMEDNKARGKIVVTV